MKILTFVAATILYAAVDWIYLWLNKNGVYSGIVLHRIWPLPLIYIGYPLAVYYFCHSRKIFPTAPLFGLAVYATYNLTNLATLPQWNWKLALQDTCWGCVITTLVASVTSQCSLG